MFTHIVYSCVKINFHYTLKELMTWKKGTNPDLNLKVKDGQIPPKILTHENDLGQRVGSI